MQSVRVMASGSVKQEVVNALRKIKYGKVAGVNGIADEFLKKEGDCVVDWLVWIFNICMDNGEGPGD